MIFYLNFKNKKLILMNCYLCKSPISIFELNNTAHLLNNNGYIHICFECERYYELKNINIELIKSDISLK